MCRTRRIAPLTLALVLGIALASTALAQAPAASTPPVSPVPSATLAAVPSAPADAAQPDLGALAELLSPLAGAQEQIVLCSPQSAFFCVNKSCQCQRFTCARCGVQSFTCDEASQTSHCVCKTC